MNQSVGNDKTIGNNKHDNFQEKVKNAPSQIKGFTLIELMIVMLILSIFITIGVSNHQSYQQKTAQHQAKSALIELSRKIEFERNQDNALPETLPAISHLVYENGNVYSAKKYYKIDYEKNGHHYVIRATWQSTAHINCHQLLLFSSGYQSAFDINHYKMAGCW